MASLRILDGGARDESRWSLSTTLVTCCCALLLAFGMLAVLAPLTPRLSFNDGLGYLDGQQYFAMVEVLKGKSELPVQAPYVYRLAPAAFVAWAELPAVAGLLLINVLSTLLCAPLVALLLRRYGVSPALALVAVIWFLALSPGLRLAVYYPALVDGVGQLLTLALLVTAVYGRFALFALVLPVALLTRENTLVLIPFLWLANLQQGAIRSGVATLLACLPGLAALSLARVVPPIPPEKGTLLSDVRQNLDWFSTNAGERPWRFLAAPVLNLGLLLAVPLARWRFLQGWLAAAPEWVWYVTAILGLAVVGGGDYDRFAYWLAPAFLVATFVALDRLRTTALVGLGLTGLQLLSIGFGSALGPDEASYRRWMVALTDVGRLAEQTLRCAAACLGGAAIAAGLPERAGPESVRVGSGAVRARGRRRPDAPLATSG